jgi:hypothetical protein
VVKANCRALLTADDFGYVVKVLAKSSQDAIPLATLLSDEETRDVVLDHDLLYQALLDDVGCVRVSPALYFYVMTRRVLRRAGLEERALCDYIAAVLTAFAHINQLGAPGPAAAKNFTYISDLLETMAKAPPEQVFVLKTHVGDYALFLSGIFADRVHAHAERAGAPGIGFYESVGQTCYRMAAQHPHARRSDLHRIFDQLAREFRAIRLALNHLTDNLLHFHEAPKPGIIGMP